MSSPQATPQAPKNLRKRIGSQHADRLGNLLFERRRRQKPASGSLRRFLPEGFFGIQPESHSRIGAP
jgi:hypothetical protein